MIKATKSKKKNSLQKSFPAISIRSNIDPIHFISFKCIFFTKGFIEKQKWTVYFEKKQNCYSM